MKRIVVLMDGTWNDEGSMLFTNIAKLDQDNDKVRPPLIKPAASDVTAQMNHYLKGFGSEPEFIRHWLGGIVGFGLKAIVLDGYRTVVENYEDGDELYLIGFSRGAYAVRALAGLIGASGIERQQSMEAAWSNYRLKPGARRFEARTPIRCVAVFDTVGSYGVPAGFGLTALARYWALFNLGFHDTTIGDHIDVGLHAVAVDERRRAFVPTFWTCPKDKPPRARVEQTWFAGVHSNVGGGYADAGLSDEALLWMIARIEALTGLEFDPAAVSAATAAANIDGEVVDSTQGWIVDHAFPHFRVVLAPDAIEHRAFANTPNPKWENVNERVHWTVVRKRGRPCLFYGRPDTPYAPANLPDSILPEKIAAITPEERALRPP